MSRPDLYGFEPERKPGFMRKAGLIAFSLAFLAIGGSIAAIKLGLVEPDTVRAAVGATSGVTPATAQTQAVQPTPASAPAGQRQVKITDARDIGDWKYSCAELDDGQRGCSIVQQIVREEPRQMLLSWRILRGADGKVRTLMHTPQAVTLNRGVAIEAGLDKPIVVPFERCGDESCVVSAQLAADFIATLAKAEKVAVLYTLQYGRAIRIPVSVIGLSDGLGALTP